MSQKRLKRKAQKQRKNIDPAVLVMKAAKGLHGMSVGFGQFIRAIPDTVLQHVPHDMPLLLMITLHAKLIVDGDPDAGVEEEFFTQEALHKIRTILSIEHLRRIGLLRVRYPRDPFEEVAEIAWWKGHPFVQVLYKLPEEKRTVLEGMILQTGDLRILSGHLMLEAEKSQMMDRIDEIEKHLPELLAESERLYQDSVTLAWNEPGGMSGNIDEFAEHDPPLTSLLQ